MVKNQISITIDREVLKKLDNYVRFEFPEGSRSSVIERAVRNELKKYKPADMSVAL